jgi:hypothetical protein
VQIRQRANVIPAERALRPASCITCRPVSLGQISSPARTRNSIPPHVADENPERKTKNQNRVDHPIKEQGSPPLGNAPRRPLRIAQKRPPVTGGKMSSRASAAAAPSSLRAVVLARSDSESGAHARWHPATRSRLQLRKGKPIKTAPAARMAPTAAHSRNMANAPWPPLWARRPLFLAPRGAPARQLTITQKRETCRAGEVRNGLKGNIGARLDEVCVTPMNGRRQTVPACPFRAQTETCAVICT